MTTNVQIATVQYLRLSLLNESWIKRFIYPEVQLVQRLRTQPKISQLRGGVKGPQQAPDSVIFALSLKQILRRRTFAV